MPLDRVRRQDDPPFLIKQMACEGVRASVGLVITFTLGLLAAPVAAEAQQAGEVRRTVEEAARKAEASLLRALWPPVGQGPDSEPT